MSVRGHSFEAIATDVPLAGVTVWFAPRATEPGTFLGKVWRLLEQPPREIVGGFSYAVGDRATGIVFEACSEFDGPSYRCIDESARASVSAFDLLLDGLTPTEWELAFSSFVQGRLRRTAIGFRSGAAFERELPEANLDDVRSVTDRERIALTLGGAYGMDVGWAGALARLPVPSFVVSRGDVLQLSGPIALPETVLVVRCDLPTRPGEPIMCEEFAIDDEIANQMPAVTRVWLDAYRARS